MIAIFAAMEAEVEPLLPSAVIETKGDVDGFPMTEVTYGGLRAVICRTGIGRCAADATAAALDRYPARAALSVGIAGGISPHFRAGDIVLGDPVCVSASSGYCDRDGSINGDSHLLDIAKQAAVAAGMTVSVGGALTVDRVVASSEEKRRLREALGHDVVEMESYWIGEAAAERGIPFLTVRVVSDEAEDSLPEMGFGNPDGTVDYSRLADWARQNPHSVELLAKMADGVRVASANLARFADACFRPEVWNSVLSATPTTR